MGLARTVETTAAPAQKPARDALAALLALGRPLVMGILNVTPDSFSDGGRFFDPAPAIAHAARDGRTRAPTSSISARNRRAPMAARSRLRPRTKSRGLRRCCRRCVKLGLPVSIDTIKASVAAWALDQGAAIVNDVWGLQRDPAMAPLVARRGVPVIVMHNREAADPAIDIVADVIAFFARSLEIAERAGIAREKIVLDPGIGFGKTPEQSIALPRAACRIQALRPAASGRRLAQAVHQFGHAVAADRAAGRLDRQPS